MRKLIVWNLVSLDGYFEGGKGWDLDFHNLVWGEELERYAIQQCQEAGLLLFGRVTYEGMAAYWRGEKGVIADFMNAVPKAVASRSLEAVDWNNTTLLDGDVGDAVARLKQQAGKDIFIFGSADLMASLEQRHLIDEYRLCLVPVMLGGGNLLFRPGGGRRPMTLLDSRVLQSGGIILRYAPVAA
ncbi:MAG TPA: dihydrofolate reductase family protein [Ferrovibrio sp.]|uniref:dihydrofolate reductase family protein n=1 Tax=Ferrovibrio sp. TaxID=1917215 RepID=UPI002ED6101D